VERASVANRLAPLRKRREHLLSRQSVLALANGSWNLEQKRNGSASRTRTRNRVVSNYALVGTSGQCGCDSELGDQRGAVAETESAQGSGPATDVVPQATRRCVPLSMAAPRSWAAWEQYRGKKLVVVVRRQGPFRATSARRQFTCHIVSTRTIQICLLCLSEILSGTDRDWARAAWRRRTPRNPVA